MDGPLRRYTLQCLSIQHWVNYQSTVEFFPTDAEIYIEVNGTKLSPFFFHYSEIQGCRRIRGRRAVAFVVNHVCLKLWLKENAAVLGTQPEYPELLQNTDGSTAIYMEFNAADITEVKLFLPTLQIVREATESYARMSVSQLLPIASDSSMSCELEEESMARVDNSSNDERSDFEEEEEEEQEQDDDTSTAEMEAGEENEEGKQEEPNNRPLQRALSAPEIRHSDAPDGLQHLPQNHNHNHYNRSGESASPQTTTTTTNHNTNTNSNSKTHRIIDSTRGKMHLMSVDDAKEDDNNIEDMKPTSRLLSVKKGGSKSLPIPSVDEALCELQAVATQNSPTMYGLPRGRDPLSNVSASAVVSPRMVPTAQRATTTTNLIHNPYNDDGGRRNETSDDAEKVEEAAAHQQPQEQQEEGGGKRASRRRAKRNASLSLTSVAVSDAAAPLATTQRKRKRQAVGDAVDDSMVVFEDTHHHPDRSDKPPAPSVKVAVGQPRSRVIRVDTSALISPTRQMNEADNEAAEAAARHLLLDTTPVTQKKAGRVDHGNDGMNSPFQNSHLISISQQPMLPSDSDPQEEGEGEAVAIRSEHKRQQTGSTVMSSTLIKRAPQKTTSEYSVSTTPVLASGTPHSSVQQGPAKKKCQTGLNQKKAAEDGLHTNPQDISTHTTRPKASFCFDDVETLPQQARDLPLQEGGTTVTPWAEKHAELQAVLPLLTGNHNNNKGTTARRRRPEAKKGNKKTHPPPSQQGSTVNHQNNNNNNDNDMALGIRTTGAPPPPQPRRAKRAPVPPIKAAPLKVDHPPHQITTATTTTTMTTTHPRSTIGDPDGSPALAAAASVLQQSMPRATKTDSGHRPLPCDYRSSGRTEPSSRRRDDAEPQATATRGGAAVITMNKSIRSVWTRDVSGEVVDNGLPSPRDGSSLEGDAGDAAFHAGSQMDGEGVLDQSEEDILKDEPFTSGKKTFTIGVMQQHHYNQNGSNVEATRALYPPYSRSRTRATTPPLLRTVSRSSVRPPPYSSSASIAPSGLHACPPLSPGSAWKEAARCAKQAERAERCMSILNQVLHLHERLRVCEGELRGIFAVMTEEMKTERQYFLDMTK